MSSNLKRWLICLFAAILCSLPQDVLACSCITPQPVRNMLEASDAVVVAKLTKVDPYTPEVNGAASLTIERVFKGDMKAGSQILLWNGSGTDCIFHFNEPGKSYLLYLSAPTSEYPARFGRAPNVRLEPIRYASLCSRSTSLEYAEQDISFLSRAAELIDKTRAYGKLLTETSSGVNILNLRIKITGETKSVELKPDKSGFFETYELPPGQYTVQFTTPRGWALEPWYLAGDGLRGIGHPTSINGNHSFQISLGARQHIEMNLLLQPTGAIRGRVLSPSGQPMKGVSVSCTVRLDADWAPTNTTNELGEFEFSRLPTGRYFLLANPRNLISAEQPFPTAYYPATDSKTEAEALTLGKDPIENIILQVPKLVGLGSVSGQTTFSDGSPAEARLVRFVPESTGYDGIFARVLEKGRFVMNVPATATGKIWAEIQLGKRDTQNCPARLKLFEGKGEDWLMFRSNEVAFPLTAEGDVRLKFPLLPCETPK